MVKGECQSPTSCIPLAGVLSLLSEPEAEVKVFSLNRLNQLVDDFWAEIADSVTLM